MFRKSIVPVAVALGLLAAPLAFAQSASTSTDAKSPATQTAPAAKAPVKAHTMKHAMPKVDINSARDRKSVV